MFFSATLTKSIVLALFAQSALACNNAAEAPKSGSGTQFVTGACKVDNDCVSGCCEVKSLKCRNALALNSAQMCHSGFTPTFDGAACAAGAVAPPSALTPETTSTPSATDTPASPSTPSITETPASSTASDSAAPPLATAAPATPAGGPNASQAPKPGSGTQFVTGACTKDDDCASGCCEVNSKKCRNALALNASQKCGSGFSPIF